MSISRLILLAFGFVLSLNVFSLNAYSQNVLGQVDLSQDDLNQVKIMTYNVQNLFDAEHDRGKTDYEFLPKNDPMKSKCGDVKGPYQKACFETDWTKQKVDLKIKQIKKILMAQGTQPDILLMQEVENPKVVQALGRALTYPAVVMTNSPDKRGIDVVMYFNPRKFKYINQRMMRVDLPFETRDVLNVNFQMPGGEILGVYGVHWPSQLGSDKGVRYKVALQMKPFIEAAVQRWGDRYHVVMAGDFNTLDTDIPHPFKEVVLNKDWPLRFANSRTLYEKAGGKGLPPGTYWYARNNEWNEFDRIFISKNLYDGKGFDVIVESFRCNTPAFATRPASNQNKMPVPKEYDHHSTSERTAGYSDHFGVLVRFKLH